MPTAKLILAEIITAVETMHKAKIVHGDVSRFNILVDTEGHVVLTDFGWAHWKSGASNELSDWERFPRVCSFLFSKQFQDENEDFIKKFNHLKDKQLPGKSSLINVYLNISINS